jgi:nucleoside 2-deoxyribosyltransferase
MTLDDLKGYGLVYLATPYSKYPQGIQVAFREAARLAARLMSSGIAVFSPVAHSHPMAIYGQVAPLNHNIWLPFDEKIMAKCDALLVAKMDTWETSFGVAHEIGVFHKAHKPVFYLEPETMAVAA